MAKRVTVTVDEQLLKDARKVTGEKTDAEAIRKALAETVRVAKLEVALDELQKEAAKGDFFWPNYMEELRPGYRSVHFPKKRVAAYEKRAPRSKRAARSR